MKTGERIKQARREKGMTQKELAEKIMKTVSSVQKYELNLARPPVDVLTSIADALGVSASYLLGFDESYKKVAEWIQYAAESAQAGMKESNDKLLEFIKSAEPLMEAEEFQEIYETRLNNKGKHEVHKYAKYLITNHENVKEENAEDLTKIPEYKKNSPDQD